MVNSRRVFSRHLRTLLSPSQVFSQVLQQNSWAGRKQTSLIFIYFSHTYSSRLSSCYYNTCRKIPCKHSRRLISACHAWFNKGCQGITIWDCSKTRFKFAHKCGGKSTQTQVSNSHSFSIIPGTTHMRKKLTCLLYKTAISMFCASAV